MNELVFPIIWGIGIILGGWFTYKIITVPKTKNKEQNIGDVK